MKTRLNTHLHEQLLKLAAKKIEASPTVARARMQSENAAARRRGSVADMGKPTEEVERIAERIKIPAADWHHNCHVVSLAILRAGVVTGRIARGWCEGVTSQHSWIVLGDSPEATNCYAEAAQVYDPTLWTYRKDTDGIWQGRSGRRHIPHGGKGSIWDWRRPMEAESSAAVIKLDRAGLSATACHFLDLLGQLDRSGWATLLSHAPIAGWPAQEIIDRAYGDKRLSVLIPIDRVGMLTDRNPDGLYW